METDAPSLEDLSARVRGGALSPMELVENSLRRLREREDEIRAWSYVAEEEARAEARGLSGELETSAPRSALHGLPFGVKDIFDTAAMPTEWGSPLYRGRVPELDAALVTRLRSLGAVVLGKTHTTAFAYFDPGSTRNPRNLAHTPGGSSSGSAAAVAAGAVPFAIGSQTLGSVLRPASFCGVVGFKPSFGRLPLDGVLPFAESLDHAGFFTRSVADMALLWKSVAGERTSKVEAPLFAAPRWPIEGELEAPMASAFVECLKRLRAAGLPIEETRLPASFERLPAATLCVLRFEAAATHRKRFERHGEALGAKLAALIREGFGTGEDEYAAAKRSIEQARADFARFAGRFPVVITPAALGPAPKGLKSTGDPRANAPWTALGVPAIAVPFGRAGDGLPLGLQLASGRGRETFLLAAAKRCEKALGEAAPVIISNLID